MELWMLCISLTLGSVHSTTMKRNNNGEYNILKQHDEKSLKTECKNYNLESCEPDLMTIQHFATSDKSNALCIESYAAVQCLHDFAHKYFPKKEQNEDYLCKLRNFQDRIDFLCRNNKGETEGEDYGKGSGDDEENALACLEGKNLPLDECLQQTMPKMETVFQGNKYQRNFANLEKFRCIVMKFTLKCVMEYVLQFCEEVTEACREYVENEIEEFFGVTCENQTVSDMISLLEREDIFLE